MKNEYTRISTEELRRYEVAFRIFTESWRYTRVALWESIEELKKVDKNDDAYELLHNRCTEIEKLLKEGEELNDTLY